MSEINLKNLKFSVAVGIMLILMVATRGNLWGLAWHLPDFTLVAFFIAGVYLRQNWVVMTLIFAAVLIDNFAIFYNGVSANCITPSYSVLLLSYYLVFWAGKFLSSLKFDEDIFKNTALIIAIIVGQWLLATISYYAFSQGVWADFIGYANRWSVVEIPPILAWMLVVFIVFSLKLSPYFVQQKSN